MPEPPSSVNSRESKHRLANIKADRKGAGIFTYQMPNE